MRWSTWERLATTQQASIAVLREGGYRLLGKAGDDKAIVRAPKEPRPKLRKPAASRWSLPVVRPASEPHGDWLTPPKEVSMATGTITWFYAQQQIILGFDRLGEGPLLLLLPALSSISTRHELRGLQERLARRFATIAIDWPGFGDQPRPAVAWQPDTYVQYLQHVLSEIAPQPFATVAAGHAAGYALRAAADVPHATGRLCLIAPTWRGPLPTMMNGRRDLGQRIARAAEWPIVGPLLYRLNVNRASMNMMARGHVYSDPNWLAGERLAQKMAVVTAPGGWSGSVRFVTGMLDPMPDSSTFLDTAQRAQDPILVIYGAETPARSKAEMQELARFAHIKLVELPAGKLALHEEFPDAVAEQILSFADKALT